MFPSGCGCRLTRAVRAGVALTDGAAPPLHQEQGCVVGGQAASCRRQGAGETAHRLLDAFAYLVGAFHEADQALHAELLPARLVFLEGTVGEEQHPVAAPELVLADDWRGSAEADREGSGAFQRLGNPAVADQQRRGMAGVFVPGATV